MIKPLPLISLLKALFDTIGLRIIGSGKGFLFLCDDETIRAKISETSVNIEGNESLWDCSGIMVRVSPQTLLELIFSSANPYIALLTGRIKIRPLKVHFPDFKDTAGDKDKPSLVISNCRQ